MSRLPAAFWADRTPRERLLIALAAALAGLWALQAGLWQPLAARRAALTAEAAHLAAAAAALANGAPPALAAPAGGEALPVLVAQTAAGFGLAVRRLDPSGEGVVQVALEEAAFADVIGFLAALETEHRLVLRAVDLTRRPPPGVVAAELTVAR